MIWLIELVDMIGWGGRKLAGARCSAAEIFSFEQYKDCHGEGLPVGGSEPYHNPVVHGR